MAVQGRRDTRVHLTYGLNAAISYLSSATWRAWKRVVAMSPSSEYSKFSPLDANPVAHIIVWITPCSYSAEIVLIPSRTPLPSLAIYVFFMNYSRIFSPQRRAVRWQTTCRPASAVLARRSWCYSRLLFWPFPQRCCDGFSHIVLISIL